MSSVVIQRIVNRYAFEAIFLVALLAVLNVPPIAADHSISDTDVRVTGAGHQAEVTVTVNPLNSNNLVGGYMEFDAAGNPHVGHASSTNGGTGWQVGLFPVPHPLGTTFDSQADPTVAFDSTGKAFFVGLAFTAGKCLPPAPLSNCDSAMLISSSTDGGASWTAPNVFRQRPGLDGEGVVHFHDKPWLAIDTTGGSFNGRIYVCWSRFEPQSATVVPSNIRFVFSTDGGATFPEPPAGDTRLSPTGRVGICSVAVGIDGTVFVTWVDLGAAPQNIRIAKSSDGGVTFTSQSVVQTITLALDPNKRPSIQGVAVDKQDSNILFVAYTDFPGNSKGEIRFTRSADKGQTWSIPTTVNDDGKGEQFFPAISTSLDRIDLVWYDGRNSANGNNVDVFYSKSYDRGSTFSPNIQINNFTIPTEGQVSTGNPPGWMGHYVGIASTSSAAYPVWTGKVATDDARDMVADKVTFPGHGGGGSVLAGSSITRADGSKIPIQNLVPGDKLQGYNRTDGQIVIVEVLGLREVTTDNLVIIRLSDGTSIRTDNNPLQKFWVKTSNGTTNLVGVPDVQVGDYLFNVPLRAWIQVVDKGNNSPGPFTMYDIILDKPDMGYIVENILDPSGCPKACPI